MYSFDSKIRYSECDSEARLSIMSLLDYFQDCSVFHSEVCTAGVDFLKEKKHAWVLSSWQIIFNRMPKLMEEVTISTWPYEMRGFYGYRNFTMKDSNGELLAYASSIWVFLDMETGRPARIPEELANKYEYEAPLEMEAGERKIKIPTDYQEQESRTVPSYFIDTNQHMNNSKYVQVAMKYVPKDFKIGQLRVEYKKAAVEGDTLIPRVTVESECITVALVAEDGKAFAIVKFFAKM